MKRLICSLAFVAMILLLTACGEKASDQVLQFATDVAQKVSSNQKDSVVAVYADAALADSLALTFNADSIKVSETETKGVFNVDFGNANMVVARDENGKCTITESHGLFAWPSERMYIAQKTGMITNDINDKQRAERMSDSLFFENINKKISEAMKGVLVLKNEGGWMDNKIGNPRHTKTLVVQNQSDVEIPASAYSISYTIDEKIKVDRIETGYGNGEWVIGYERDKSGKLDGVAIPPKGQQSFSISTTSDYYFGSAFCGMVYKASIKINTDDPALKNCYTFTGNEYAEYLQSKSASNK